jgi:hypothetical protein
MCAVRTFKAPATTAVSAAPGNREAGAGIGPLYHLRVGRVESLAVSPLDTESFRFI